MARVRYSPDPKPGRTTTRTSSPARRYAPATYDRPMAVALNPQLLIADEPTTALDVTVQAQIIDAARRASSAELDMAVVLITHDIALVAE